MEFVCNRLEFKDRINGEYFVITGHVPDDEIEQLRFHISLAQVEPMKTQDMQWFFRCPQKSNALIDTFNICVAHASDSHLKNVPIGKKFLIELSQKGAVQVPHKVVPVDYVLLMAPYLKVCATDTLSNGNIRMAVKVLSDKNGDFNQILFSILRDIVGALNKKRQLRVLILIL